MTYRLRNIAIAVALGLAIGFGLGMHRLSADAMEPMLVALYSIPKITLYPILLLAFGLGMSAKVAFGASCFPYDVGYAPLWWAKVSLAENIVFWKEHSHSGHFPSVECPEELKNDIWAFVGSLSKETRDSLKSGI